MKSETLMEQKTTAYKEGVGQLAERYPDLIEAYNAFTGYCFADGALSARDKQLIALGISLFSNNEVCTYMHVQEALSKGASADAVMETAAVAAALGGGHALSQGVTRVQQALGEAAPLQ